MDRAHNPRLFSQDHSKSELELAKTDFSKYMRVEGMRTEAPYIDPKYVRAVGRNFKFETADHSAASPYKVPGVALLLDILNAKVIEA